MRQEFPFLAEATQGYALGDVWSRPGLNGRTRQLAAVAAFVPAGDRGIASALGDGRRTSRRSLQATLRSCPMKRISLVAAIVLLAGAAIPSVQKGLARMNVAQSTVPHSSEAHPYAGMWVTADGHIRHKLLPNGRYDEARGSRESAYRGRYEVRGNRIDYWDDTGFTADGTFIDGVLHHGGMIFYRQK